MKIDSVKKSLDTKMGLDSISMPELKDGITECFILTNRNFLRRRMGEKSPTSEMDKLTRDLAAQVYAENNISESYLSMSDLRKACSILDNQLGFETNPELAQHHQEIIGKLFNLASL
ncbi:MAG: hypothetical protein H8E29_06095 [Anaerolineales bacterium]|uniref:Uncharacterized protein n=1 Tax=Candidatus Desulfolinea nitratireducens TaxID=2841698 RepID=A0A8J6NJ92_9CHLR|nr:hypothetical protein [Candidatus Desulfolinea nitratireducens]